MRKLYFVLSVDAEEEWDWDGPFPNQMISVKNIDHLPVFQSRLNELELTTSYFLDYAVLENAHHHVLREVIGRLIGQVVQRYAR